MSKNELVVQAVKDGSFPRFLYKYRDLRDRTRSMKMIENAEFWFAQAKTFNDPFDCNLSETRLHRIKDFKAYLLSHNFSIHDVNNHVQQAKKNINLIRNYVVEAREDILNKHGILSLSKVYDNILMWSHYAFNHTGIVIALDILEDPGFFIHLLNVKYQDTYKELDHFSNEKRSLLDNLTTKSSFWRYEEEVRVIYDKYGPYSIKRDAIRKIYFGCKTPDADIREVMALCKNSGYKRVKFFQGNIVHGAFKLSFSQVK